MIIDIDMDRLFDRGDLPGALMIQLDALDQLCPCGRESLKIEFTIPLGEEYVVGNLMRNVISYAEIRLLLTANRLF